MYKSVIIFIKYAQRQYIGKRNNFNIQLYSINSGAADCATGASVIYK